MIYTKHKNRREKPLIVIEDTDAPDFTQEVLEEPVISIESDDDKEENAPAVVVKRQSRLKYWGMQVLKPVALVVLMLVCYKGIRLYNYYYNIGVNVAVSPKENIQKLASMKADGRPSEVVLKSDSILGVALNIYELRNVRAEMTLTEPDTTDHNVLLYTRTADYTPTGKYIGSLVIDGEEKRHDVSRLGYCAMVGGNMVIGISRSDNVKEYVIDRDGSFFRQFILVSDGELPKRFVLHGKVERKAIGRMADDRLCIIETRHPETLWDFADALREYGFVDAIYLTGGNESGFYRAQDGTARFAEKAELHRNDMHHGIVPWLVLTKK